MKKILTPWWLAACREPYRIFFPLGVWMGAVGIGHWLFYALHWLPRYSAFFHSSIQMLVYMNCFVIGFLMTAIPRFTSTPSARPAEVLWFLFLFAGMVLLISLEEWVATEGVFVVWLISLLVFVAKRIVQRIKLGSTGKKPPLAMVWLPLGVIAGTIGTVLLMLGQLRILPLWVLGIGKPMMEQGFLLCVVLGIGGFLIPRLMGTYVLAAKAGHNEELCDQPQKEVAAQGSPVKIYLFLFLVFLCSFVLEGMKELPWAYGLRALVMTIVFIRTQVIPGPPKTDDFYVRLVWLSAWMVAIGLWGAALRPAYHIVWLHVMFIGGFSLMTFAVASMVIMSHAGEGDKLRKPLWIFWMMGLGLAMVVLKRAAVVFFPDQYFQFLGISAGIWLVVGLSWFIFILPRIFRIPQEDEFGKLHDQAVKKAEAA